MKKIGTLQQPILSFKIQVSDKKLTKLYGYYDLSSRSKDDRGFFNFHEIDATGFFQVFCPTPHPKSSSMAHLVTFIHYKLGFPISI